MSNKILARNIGSMGIAVFISRIFGLLRDVIMTAVFGTSWVADAFQVGYQIPNLLRKLFGEGALSSAFIPVYNEIGIRDGRKNQINFALNIISILNLLLLVLSIIGILAAPLIVRLLAPGFDTERFLLTVKLTRLMFPYLYFIGFSSTLIAILNSHDRFFLPGLSSAFLNIGMIGVLAAYIIFNPASSLEDKILATAAGVVLGGLLQTIVNLPLLKKLGYKMRFYLNLKDKSVSTVGRLFLPGVFGLAIRQINLAADLIIASFLPAGSIAALNYGNRLMQLPLGIIGVSAGVAVLPLFSRYAAEKKWDELHNSLRFSLITLCFLMIPITGIIFALGRDITGVIFMRGAFNEKSLQMTNMALVFYSTGLIFYSLNRQIIPIFYARKNTKTPVKISAVIVALNIVLNIILMQWLQHGGLALATSLSSLAQFLILMHYLKKLYPEMILPNILPEVLKIVIITATIYIILLFLQTLYTPVNFWQSALRLIILLVISGILLFPSRKLIKFK
ncbi:MAG: murein biosynthesis integral membrane protein MurJ [Candidatus Cloacimonetes bacterium]|nr:murein biosynthesis integral membrane protein MurJ [Candidatus Cloacimonadota bacterium]